MKEKGIKSGEYAFTMSAGLTSEKLAKARVEMGLKSMVEDTDGTYANGSIVINKYGIFCRDLINDPEPRLKYWLEKSD